MMKTSTLLRFLCCLLLLPNILSAYVLQKATKWNDGTVTLQLQLDATQPITISFTGSITANKSAEQAYANWNSYMGRVQLAGTTPASASFADGDDKNNIAFSATIYGDAFDSNVLAVTLVSYDDTKRIESDILVNSSKAWTIFEGSLSGRIDLRRVLTHEMGHVLGLGHPDENGQSVSALMNAYISGIEKPTDDDKNGVVALYGYGTANKPIPPTLYSYNPSDVSVYEGQDASFYVSVNSSTGGVSYQWYKNGSAISGAIQSTYSISSVSLADAGQYSAKVTDKVGTAISREAKLTVNPAISPSFSTTDTTTYNVYIGGYISLYATLKTGTNPMTYKWYKNGSTTPVTTSSSLYISQAKPSDAGVYYMEATNYAGTTRSALVTLNVLPIPLPQIAPYEALLYSTIGYGISLNFSQNYATAYQWYKDGILIPKATNSSYNISSVSYSDVGDYTVVMSNSSGSWSSAAVRLALNGPTSQPIGTWLYANTAHNIAYFFYANPARIERFDLAANVWLSPLVLKASPIAASIYGDTIFITYERDVYSYSLDLQNEKQILAGLDYDITSLIPTAKYLIINSYDSTNSRQTLQLFSSYDMKLKGSYSYYLPSKNTNIYPLEKSSELIIPRYSSRSKLGYSDNGFIDNSTEIYSVSTYKPVYIKPDESGFFEGNGRLLNSSKLAFASGLGGSIDDLVWLSSQKLAVLRPGKIVFYNARYEEIASLDADPAIIRIFPQGDDVVGFIPPSSGSSAKNIRYLFSSATKVQQAPVIDPANTNFAPTDMFVGTDGLVYLSCPSLRHIFRWNPATGQYCAKHIRLSRVPRTVTYSPSQNSIFLADLNSAIYKINLAGDTFSEEFVANNEYCPNAFAPVAKNLIVSDSSTLRTFSETGQIIFSASNNVQAGSMQYDSAAQRLLTYLDSNYYQSGTVYSLPVTNESILNTMATFHSSSVSLPIFISPDGHLLSGKGMFYNAKTLLPDNDIGCSIAGAAWSGSTLYIIANTLDGYTIQRRGGYNYGADASITDSGYAQKILTLPDGRLVLAAWVSGSLRLRIYDANLQKTSAGPASRLLGIAARAPVGKGDDVLIPGFVISGTKAKTVMIRAIGPSLQGISNPLLDPKFTLNNVTGAVIASNDNWEDAPNLAELKSTMMRITGSVFAPGTKDAALLITLEPGAYTAVIRGVNDTTGIGMVDVYDTDDDASGSRLMAIATRANVGRDERALYAGFVIDGAKSHSVHVQGIGPTLKMIGAMPNPRLRVMSGSQVVQQNNDWNNDPAIISARAKSYASTLDPNSKDASALATLAPGAYTVIIDNEDGPEGIAMVELYEMPDE
jgi:hypothetical protein